MLYMFSAIKQIRFDQLMAVYLQSNTIDGAEFAHLSVHQQILEGEQRHYAFLKEFFQMPGSYCAVWAPEGQYEAALRTEPYKDGYLIEAVETRPESRRKGYAKSLLQQVLAWLEAQGVTTVYSHIDRRNTASVRLHRSCGFEVILDHAVYIDGSVDRQADTYCKKL